MGFDQISSPHKLDEHPSLSIDMSLPSTWAYCMVKLTCIKNEIQITTKFLHKPSQCLLENYFTGKYFRTPILAKWQMKDYKERNNFILRITF